MAKSWFSKIIGKLVGQGLASKYSTNSLEPQVDDVRPFTQAPKTDGNDATFTQAPRTGDHQSILKSLKPTQPATVTQIPRTEYDIPAAGLTDSELPRIPIDLSCSFQEHAAHNEGVNTREDISGFKNWDAETARGYPVVAPPPMTGIGRYRRSKTATKEWVEHNTLKQLGNIAPYVMTPIEDITGPSDWDGLYGKSRGESSKLGSKSPIEVDPDTGASIVRGFSTVSVAMNPRGSNSIGPATNATMPRTSATPAVPSSNGTENRQANPLPLSYAEDDCVIESYDLFAPGDLRRGPSASRGGPENTYVAAPASPSSEVSYDDSVPEEFLALHSDAPTGALETEPDTTPVDNPATASPSDSYYDSVPEEFLASSVGVSTGAPETEPENTPVGNPAPSSAVPTASAWHQWLTFFEKRMLIESVVSQGELPLRKHKGFTSESNNPKETGNSSEAESYLALREAIYNDQPLPGSGPGAQETGNRASHYDSSKSGRYSTVREALLNDQPLPQFGSETQRSQSAGPDAGPDEPDDGGDYAMCNACGSYHGPHLNDYFEPLPRPNSAQKLQIAEFWDRALRDEETSHQQAQNYDVESVSESLRQIGSSSAMEVGGGSQNTSSVMAAHTGPDLRFINRYWDRLYDTQREEDALRTQGIDVEAEEGQEPKGPLYAGFKTGTFEELEEYRVKESPPSPLEAMEPRNAAFGMTELPRRTLYKRSKTRRGPVCKDQ